MDMKQSMFTFLVRENIFVFKHLSRINIWFFNNRMES